MLEAIVDLRRNNTTGKIGDKDTATKKTGDIICVKKSPAVWGKKEKEDFLIVFLDDPVLEASMNKSFKIYPYKVIDDVETPVGTEKEMVNRSKYKIDHTPFVGTDSLDTSKEVGAVKPSGKDNLELADMTLDDKARQ